jgi:hypothetical protein
MDLDEVRGKLRPHIGNDVMIGVDDNSSAFGKLMLYESNIGISSDLAASGHHPETLDEQIAGLFSYSRGPDRIYQRDVSHYRVSTF